MLCNSNTIFEFVDYTLSIMELILTTGGIFVQYSFNVHFYPTNLARKGNELLIVLATMISSTGFTSQPTLELIRRLIYKIYISMWKIIRCRLIKVNQTFLSLVSSLSKSIDKHEHNSIFAEVQ